MQGKLTDAAGQTVPATVDAVRERLTGDAFFWLDLEGLDAESSGLLLREFGFHPLAVEDAEHFGQRPKVDDFDGFTYLVLHGALPSPATAVTCEVHVFFSAKHVVSVHQGDGGIFDGVRRRAARHRAAAGSSAAVSVLYLIVDELVDTYFPVLAQLDDRIDALEDAILKQPTEAQLGELFAMKRTLVTLRKVVTPERDMFARLLSGMNLLEGMTPEDERYFRDLYDHLIRISDLVDSYRDLLTGAMDPPLHCLQPAQRGHEAADHHRHRLPSAQLPDRLLRAELHLSHRPRADSYVVLLGARRRPRAGRGRRAPLPLPPARLAGRPDRVRPPSQPV